MLVSVSFVFLTTGSDDVGRGTETQRKDIKNLLYGRRLLMMMMMWDGKSTQPVKKLLQQSLGFLQTVQKIQQNPW